MTRAPETFYLTTPIYYVNAAPHLGHAYTTIVADTMARYRRLRGDRVWFLTGTDEHGDKIAQAAAAAGVTPQVFTDRISAAFRETWARLGITYDDYIRTTEPRHQRVVQAVLQRLWDAGEIYLGKYGGHYCFGCERFYTEKEIVDGACPDHRTPLTWIEEENYFFRMSKYQRWLVAYIEARPELIRPERYRNEILGFLRDPLQDLSISRPRRRLQWGIPLPFDDGYVTYVWFDALINYISALEWPDGERFQTFWPAAQHLIGKDILKPHAVYWPCMLKALGDAVAGRTAAVVAPSAADEPLMYRHLTVHGYWNVGGGKMSKSIGNVVEALALTEKYGNDAFRYFVLREIVFGLDADFSEEAFVTRLNAELANDLGNLVSRVTTLIVNAGGLARVPGEAELDEAARTIRDRFAGVLLELDDDMAQFALHRALARLWELVSLLNGYVDLTKPWELAKHVDAGSRMRLSAVLYTLAESLRCLGILLSPFVPEAAARIRAALGIKGEPHLDDAVWGRGAAGVPVQKLTGLFPRVASDAPDAPATAGGGEPPRARTPGAGSKTAAPVRAAAGVAAEGGADAMAPPGPNARGSAGDLPAAPGAGDVAERETRAAAPRPTTGAPTGTDPDARIGQGDFGRVELRVAEVVNAEAVPKSRKLLRLTVSLGTEERTVVAGIAEYYAPADLVGKKVVIVANLEPVRLMGIESNGMILAGSAEGRLAVLTLDRDLPAGARVS